MGICIIYMIYAYMCACACACMHRCVGVYYRYRYLLFIYMIYEYEYVPIHVCAHVHAAYISCTYIIYTRCKHQQVSYTPQSYIAVGMCSAILRVLYSIAPSAICCVMSMHWHLHIYSNLSIAMHVGAVDLCVCIARRRDGTGRGALGGLHISVS